MEEAKSLDYYESQKVVCNMGITHNFKVCEGCY